MPDKSLGQHWLKDRSILAQIAEEADLSKADTVLEVGPGLGTLTSELLRRAERVVAVEFDANLARKLPGQFPGKNLSVINGDILSYDPSELPRGYKVVANIPYYITGKIIRHFIDTENPPATIVILVQKEVAERVASAPGEMSILSVMTQLVYRARLGVVVSKELFTPPPKVESQTVILTRRTEPLVADEDKSFLMRVVRVGFAEKRKKLRTNLANGLGVTKELVDAVFREFNLDPNIRAQELSVEEWIDLASRLR